jgi:tRNA1Val (adenine37-N6)-methyltransferase
METPQERRARIEAERGEAITLDALTGAWSIVQRAAGHRHSTDDVLTAYHALRHGPRTEHALDLGAGIGTVGLLTLWGLGPTARLTCVEAQSVSFALLRENLAMNDLERRVEAIHGDLREARFHETFSLVTGSPPYFDVRAGVVPADSQKAHARFELRGTVRDYARAARAAMGAREDGRFVFCFPSAQRARGMQAARDAGMSVIAWRDVIPRAGRAPLFTLYACRAGAHPEREEAPLLVRDAAGAHTEEMREVRRGFGFAVP